jgi:tetratricopeptide (TPR) repeat protein/predicted Ser/Thr protein kinase
MERTDPASLPDEGPSGWPSAQTLADEPLRRGAMIGRYLVLSRIGEGGMGVVYACYDDILDRKVAVKLLRGEITRDSAAALMQREAQALAKLNHPNVVAVHDVGALGERVYLAMEFVDGQTLGSWLKASRRGWREVLRVILAAGDGLAAAHAKGLIHRDIKPDNIMVGADGRVRVMDFGLVHAESQSRIEFSQRPPSASSSTPELTPDGALLGTPSYMSPEQWRGDPVDARSDQFSLCVALWEAIYGARPFAGQSWPALRAAVLAGALTEPVEPRRAPKWLRRVIERGLAVAPDTRFPSIEALLAALADGQLRRRRRYIFTGGALAVCVVSGAVAWQQIDHSARIAACSAEGAIVRDQIWSDDIQSGMKRVFIASRLSFAETTFDSLVPHIDAWIDAWSRARGDSCVDTEVRKIRPADLHALAIACLDEQREAVQALLESFAEGDRYAVRSALRSVTKLPKVEDCQVESKLRQRALLPGDPKARVRVLELRRELSAIERLRFAGRYAEGLARAEPALALADLLGHVPLQAELRVQQGLLAIEAGRYAEAEQALTRAFFVAGSSGLDELATNAAMEIAFVLGYRQGRTAEALAWAHTADMLVHRLGQQSGLLGASVASNTGLVRRARGELLLAQSSLERALKIREERYQRGAHPNIAGVLGNLAEIHAARGDLERATELHRRALEIREATLGPDHPRVGFSMHGLAQVARARGELSSAGTFARRALMIWEQTLGATHPDVGAALLVLGEITLEQGDAAEAVVHLERAATIWDEGHSRPEELATLRFTLARALAAAAADQASPRARELAQQAANTLRAGPAPLRARLPEIELWLDTHPIESDPNDL